MEYIIRVGKSVKCEAFWSVSALLHMFHKMDARRIWVNIIISLFKAIYINACLYYGEISLT